MASKSPRRRELLREIFDEFDIIVSEVDEELGDEIKPEEGVRILAIRKGDAVAEKLPHDTMVISSDTLVELGGTALGKPGDFDDAVSMLRRLSEKTHNVHTGVAVHYMDKCFSGVATTSVHFRKIEDEELFEYVKSGEPMDKAGAYGIQGEGGKFVSGFDGDYDTVVGLSTRLTRELVNQALCQSGEKI